MNRKAREEVRRKNMEELVNQYHVGDDKESLTILLELAYEYGARDGYRDGFNDRQRVGLPGTVE